MSFKTACSACFLQCTKLLICKAKGLSTSKLPKSQVLVAACIWLALICLIYAHICAMESNFPTLYLILYWQIIMGSRVKTQKTTMKFVRYTLIHQSHQNFWPEKGEDEEGEKTGTGHWSCHLCSAVLPGEPAENNDTDLEALRPDTLWHLRPWNAMFSLPLVQSHDFQWWILMLYGFTQFPSITSFMFLPN